jgi:hypothetical protein
VQLRASCWSLSHGVGVRAIWRQVDDGDRTAWWNARTARGKRAGRRELLLGGNGENGERKVSWTARTAAGRDVLRGLTNGYVICSCIDGCPFFFLWSARADVVCWSAPVNM